jgi:hypothetical protein
VSQTPRPGVAQRSVALALLVLGALLALGSGCLRRDRDQEGSEEGASPALARVTSEDGTVVLALSPDALARAGLRSEPLEATSYRGTVRAYATVVDLHDLLDLRDRYAAAAGSAAAARARAAASRRELVRLRGLYRDGRNVSATALESAEATAAVDRAAEKASAAPVGTLAALARQDFGPVLAGWMTAGAPALGRLLAGHDALIEVALPPDVLPATPPARATLLLDGGPQVPARFVSPAARTDPRIQGLALYYLAPAQPGLVADRNVVAILPLGAAVEGVRVPDAAVVWDQGRAWVYVSRGAARYARHELRSDRPVAGGYVVTDLAPGTEVVVGGAEVLLSEEFRAQHPRHGEEEEGDAD